MLSTFVSRLIYSFSVIQIETSARQLISITKNNANVTLQLAARSSGTTLTPAAVNIITHNRQQFSKLVKMLKRVTDSPVVNNDNKKCVINSREMLESHTLCHLIVCLLFLLSVFRRLYSVLYKFCVLLLLMLTLAKIVYR